MNRGSSSLRFALYSVAEPMVRLLSGKLDRIGNPGAQLTIEDASGTATTLPCANIEALLPILEARIDIKQLRAIGHRMVHGLEHAQPERITNQLLQQLHAIEPFAPNHLPNELALAELLAQRFPALPQVACFDTAFHSGLPMEARTLPIPRHLAKLGLRRYGFHGLSYAFLLEELQRVDATAAQGRIIFAHLGNGASLAAVREGKCVDTTMGFTPAGGLLMSSRTGDMDPGVFPYLLQAQGFTADTLHRMIHEEAGMLGISETTSDMRDLLRQAPTDARSAEAIACFCYQARKAISAFAGALGGLDTLVFAGGIGENLPQIRAQICEGLNFLGLHIDTSRNAANDAILSTPDSRVTVRRIATNEELQIARQTRQLLALHQEKET